MDPLQLLENHRDELLDDVVARLQGNLPQYTLLNAAELRQNAGPLVDQLIAFLRTGNEAGLTQALLVTAELRVRQGFALSEFLQALFAAFPAVRELLDRHSGGDVAVARAYSMIESRAVTMLASAANIFSEMSARQLQAKNRELNSLNQRLQAAERRLAAEADQTSRQLDTAVELNQGVIESLSAGVMVIEPNDQLVSLYTSRMENILGIPSEQALGRPVLDALQGLRGLDGRALLEMVVLRGRLPITRLHLHRPDGRSVAVYVRAQRMFDRHGDPMGTVVVVDDVTERELLVDSFSRYVSRDLLNRVLSRAEPVALGGERRVCTVFFADIRGFTALAEDLPPEDLHSLLNDYFRVVIGQITAHGGFVDKFIGDNVMALFSEGPAAQTAVAAARAARGVLLQVEELNLRRAVAELAPIRVGIGLNVGEVLLGNIGSEDRMDFTAIGDAVNVAARLQSMATGGEVLMSGAVAEHVRGLFPLEDRGRRPVRGRTQDIGVFVMSAGH